MKNEKLKRLLESKRLYKLTKSDEAEFHIEEFEITRFSYNDSKIFFRNSRSSHQCFIYDILLDMEYHKYFLSVKDALEYVKRVKIHALTKITCIIY